MPNATKTAPFVAIVHTIKEIEGKRQASFDGLNSWYSVPSHLEGILSQAAEKHSPIKITTNRSEILTAELEPPSASCSKLSVLSQFGREAIAALVRLTHPTKRRLDRTLHHTFK